jgi:hypothetical protein
MAFSLYPFDQWMTLKKVYLRDHPEIHFEDPIKKKFFNISAKSDLPRYSESSIGERLLFVHDGLGGGYRRFDF